MSVFTHACKPLILRVTLETGVESDQKEVIRHSAYSCTWEEAIIAPEYNYYDPHLDRTNLRVTNLSIVLQCNR